MLKKCRLLTLAGLMILPASLSLAQESQPTSSPTKLSEKPKMSLIEVMEATPAEPLKLEGTLALPIVDVLTAKDPERVFKISGTVRGAYDNAVILVQDATDCILVHLNSSQWELGLKLGDIVNVEGKINPKYPLRVELDAEKIDRTGQVTPAPRSLIRQTISEMLSRNKPGDIVAVRGKSFKLKNPREFALKDSTLGVIVELGADWEKVRVEEGKDIIVVGIVRARSLNNTIEAVRIIPFRKLERKGEPDQPTPMSTLMNEKPIEQLVRVRGEVSQVFFEGTRYTVVRDRKNTTFVVYPDARYESIQPRLAEKVDVIGRFYTETHRDKEFGAIHEARLEPVKSP